ncbi:unnamed protein product [Schistocephalus solidus]|uniref:Uncharacterized protein n=1 Tax=Schistocephalus solidus TaxID=70667 RepID=A0A183TRP8_SCHSO|nr:unnamed protein product [Schistocephalus solidus]
MLSVMLTDAYRDEHHGIQIAYRNDGILLNSRRMQAQTRESMTSVHNLLFAIDGTFNTVSEEEMQRSTKIFEAGWPILD